MRKKPVDALDVKIINHLQNNANITNRSLAQQIGLSPGPTLVRVQNLWKRKIFAHYKAQIDYTYFKFNYKAIAIITIDPKTESNFISNVLSQREVIYCAKLEKRFNMVSSLKYTVSIMIKSQEHLDKVITKISQNIKVYDMDVTMLDNIIKDENLLIDIEDI